jgi:ribose 5-phosphate isomerase B
MRIAIGSDHRGYDLKQKIISLLKAAGHEYQDFGVYNTTRADYPSIAGAVGEAVAARKFERGILICGTGIGMSIVANKIKGIRCAQVFDLFTAEMVKAHNDANFIAFGGRVKYSVPVTDMIEKFMNTNFAGDRHQRRIAKIMDLDKKR